jgi:hypothetical protein
VDQHETQFEGLLTKSQPLALLDRTIDEEIFVSAVLEGRELSRKNDNRETLIFHSNCYVVEKIISKKKIHE